HAVTNQVVLIQMDNESYSDLGQERYDPQKAGSQPWRRDYHTRLLKKLADGGALLVVMDIFFGKTNDPAVAKALSDQMARQKNLVLMGKPAEVVSPRINGVQPGVDGVQPVWPADIFLEAARTNCGIAYLSADLDSIVREQWPFPSPNPSTPPQFYSLPWEAALLAGAKLDNIHPRERWLRYYQAGTWTRISYVHALREEPASGFHDKIVFIGNQPEFTAPDKPEIDKFCTPFSRWTGEAYGGVDINITAFLNLMNGDWLERLPLWAEGLVVIVAGILLGGGLCKLRPLPAVWTALAVAMVVALGSVSWSYFGNRWFPWMVIVAGQVPFALAWAIFMPAFHRVQETLTVATVI